MTEKWKIDATSVEAISEMQDLTGSFSSMKLNMGQDTWDWDLGSSKLYSVAAFKEWIRSANRTQQKQRMIWENWLPLKVNMFIWRMGLDRIPTRLNFAKRRINIVDELCPLCDTEAESSLHIMVNCGFAFGVWSKVWSWCKIEGWLIGMS